MSYLLDTSTCVSFLRRRSSPVIERLAATRPEDVYLCSIVKAELYYGAHYSHQPERELAFLREFVSPFQSLPFDDRAAEMYGPLRAYLRRGGMLIGPNDLLIASVALAHSLILVTCNTREFSRVKSLNIENWEVLNS